MKLISPISRLIKKTLNLPKSLLENMRENPAHYAFFSILTLLTWRGLPVWMPNGLSEVVPQLGDVFLVLLALAVYVLASKNRGENERRMPSFMKGHIELWCFVILTIIAVLGLLLRLKDLSILDPYTDENGQLMVATRLMRGEEADYSRGTALSILVSWLFKWVEPSGFREHLFWARLPGVVVSVLTVFPLYLLAKRISRPVALTASALLLFCPWAIGVSRYFREYAYYPLFVVLALSSFLSLGERIKGGVKANARPIVGHALYLILFSVYALLTDPESTLKIGFIAMSAALIWQLLAKLSTPDEKASSKVSRLLSVLLVLSFASALVVLSTGAIGGLGFVVQPRFLNIFLSPDNKPPLLWWYGYPAFEHIGLLFIVIGALAAAFKKNTSYFLFLFMAVSLILFFYLFFDRYFRPRYCYYVLPFFAIVVAAGVCHLVEMILTFKATAARVLCGLLIGAFLFTVFDYRNVEAAIGDDMISPLQHRDLRGKKVETVNTGYFQVTGEFHQDMRDAIKFLRNKVEKDDVFITTVYGSMLMLALNVPSKKIFHYNHKRPEAFQNITDVILKNKRGWVIVDFRRHGHMGPIRFPLKKKFIIENETLELVRNKNDTQIFRWNHE